MSVNFRLGVVLGMLVFSGCTAVSVIDRQNRLPANNLPITIIDRQERLATDRSNAKATGGQAKVLAKGLFERPELRIEANNPTTFYSDIATDASGKWLVTTSMDRTVKVWPIDGSEPARTIHPPLGDGAIGSIDSVAISPDGKMVAVGWLGQEAAAILIFDRATGNLVKKHTGLINAVAELRYSPDGKMLAATIVSGGVQVFSTASGEEIGRDNQYAGDAKGLDFSRDGKLLVTASQDGFMRLYRVEGRAIKKVSQVDASQSLGKPRTVRFSPDGQLIAVAYTAMGGVSVHKTFELAAVTKVGSSSPLVQDGMKSNAPAIAWSANGQFLYASGWWDQGDARIRRWGLTKTGQFNMISPRIDISTVTGSPATRMVALPAGGVAFVTKQALGVVLPDNRLAWKSGVVTLGSEAFVLSSFNPPPLLVSHDGTRIGVSYLGNDPVSEFDVQQRLLKHHTSSADLLPRITELPGMKVSLPLGPSAPERPAINGQELPIPKHEFAFSYAISPDGKRAAVITTNALWMFDNAGKQLWMQAKEGVAVAFSGDGRWLVARGMDAVRWYRAADGQLALTLFAEGESGRWLLWTPEGAYDASVGGDELAGWHVNRGADNAADFFPLARFRSTFLRPDLVSAALRVASNDVKSEPLQSANVEKVLPPVVSILSPTDDEAMAGRELKVRYSLRSPSGQPITQVKVMFDGRPATVKVPIGNLFNGVKGAEERSATLSVTVPGNVSLVSLIAETSLGASEPAVLRLQQMAERSAKRSQPTQTSSPQPAQPKLFALAVGVGDYPPPVRKLDFPAKDAQDFARTLKANGRIYSDIQIRTVEESNATRAAILEQLEWLRNSVGPNDVAVLFLAGHGETDSKGTYYYLARNTDRSNLAKTGVTNTDIIRAVSVLKGRVIVFLDTCHAGAINSARLDTLANELKSPENGAIVFAASSGEQTSLESSVWNNGAFTKTVVDGLSGNADFDKDGFVTVSGLDHYVSRQVPKLTNNKQTPVVRKPGTIPDFAVTAQ